MPKFAVLLLLAVVAAGCSSSPVSPSNAVAFAVTDLRVGTGASAESGSTLTVDYTGWLYDATKTNQKGLQFDTSIGASPFTFILGSGAVIDGWEQGLLGMKVGGLRRLVIPPSLAYGGERQGPVPANAALVFEVELIDVQ